MLGFSEKQEIEITSARDVYMETVKGNYKETKGDRESLQIPFRLPIGEGEREERVLVMKICRPPPPQS